MPIETVWRHCPRTGWALALLTCLALVGCHSERELPRFDLSGAVAYDGRPVPAGYIEFAPDVAQGNDGPGSSAEIRDGRYATLPERGTIGGPHVVTLRGFSGLPATPGAFAVPSPSPTAAHQLFTTKVNVDLPRKAGVHDFEIPKQ